MELTVFNGRENSTQKVDFKGRIVQELLQHLQLNQEVFLVVRKGEVLTGDERLHDHDVIELLSIISGG